MFDDKITLSFVLSRDFRVLEAQRNEMKSNFILDNNDSKLLIISTLSISPPQLYNTVTMLVNYKYTQQEFNAHFDYEL